MITGVLSAKHGYFNYYAELETAGKCFDWVINHLALDEVGIYLKNNKVTDEFESRYISIYDYLSEVIRKVPPGANGVIFTPWMHGNRCPFEDSTAGGMFFNIRIENGKRDMLRAVLEGICYHLRWLLECEDVKVKTSDPIRFVGGGSLSPVTCQMLADITGKTIETVDSPQNIGAVGAAIVIAVGCGILKDITDAKKLIPATKTFKPNFALKSVYDRNYKVFKALYKANKENFAILNEGK
jgi:xylulokinase